MTRKTIIFGNGLGMALDPEFFRLDKAIGRAWDGQTLNAAQKKLILRCLPEETRDCPYNEDDMDILQLALSACDLLNQLGDGHTHWLTEEGQEFPLAVRTLFYEVASGFHQSGCELPSTFSDSLAQFLKNTKSHVATLNYDNLIYSPLIQHEVLNGYDGALCDGFYQTGFSPENLERKYEHAFGYYLHLHGSPLFVERNGATVKVAKSDLVSNNNGDIVSSHIVLTHVKHKPAVIGASELLTTYWQYLTRAFQESNEILLVGYSGLDTHLNDLLKGLLSRTDIRVRVVEWNGEGDEETRCQFWCTTLAKREITLVHLPSILDFDMWDDVATGGSPKS